MVLNLEKSSAGLTTKRLLKQTLILMLSGILGSVFGMMSAIGGVMQFLEKQRDSHKRGKVSKIKLINALSMLKMYSQNGRMSKKSQEFRPCPQTELIQDLSLDSDKSKDSKSQEVQTSKSLSTNSKDARRNAEDYVISPSSGKCSSSLLEVSESLSKVQFSSDEEIILPKTRSFY